MRSFSAAFMALYSFISLFKEYYRKCCDKYLDPIEVAQHEMISQKYVKDGIIETKVICFHVQKYILLLILGFQNIPGY